MPTVSIDLATNYQTDATVRNHTLRADEPEHAGGDDTGPTPVEMLLASIGSCMAITMKLYAGRKKWPLKRVEIEIENKKVKPEDCPDYENKDGRKDLVMITSQIRLHGDLTDEQKTRIAEIGGRCPVHKIVEKGAYFVDELTLE